MKYYFPLLFLLLFHYSFAQRNVKDSTIATPLIGVHYGGNWTEGDLAERYGFASHLGTVSYTHLTLPTSDLV